MVNVKHPLYQDDLKYVAECIRRSELGVAEKKVLIIGATGLIGSFLTDALVYYNKHVKKQFDIWTMGRKWERLQDRFSYLDENEIHLWEHDINLALDTDIRFDYIFHLASNADPGAYKAFPVETIATNVQGTLNVLEYLGKHKTSKALFTSTMEVYGESEGRELSESDYGAINFNSIRAGYPESKRVSELLYRSAVEQYGINAYIARMGYIYGPTMTDSDNKVVAQFLRNGASGKDLELQSAGLQNRTYCYVADAVAGMIQIIVTGRSGEVYNVADKSSKVSIRELGEIVAKVVNVQLYVPGDENLVGSVVGDDKVLNTDKLQELGWCAKIGIEQGVRRAIEILQ